MPALKLYSVGLLILHKTQGKALYFSVLPPSPLQNRTMNILTIILTPKYTMWYIGSLSDMQKTCKNLSKYFVLIHLVLLLFLQNKARETPVYETNQSCSSSCGTEKCADYHPLTLYTFIYSSLATTAGVKQSHSSVDYQKILIFMMLAARYWGCFK